LIERMAALLRFSLDANRSGLVPLDQELKVDRDYPEMNRRALAAAAIQGRERAG
jgi:hypothetical protein